MLIPLFLLSLIVTHTHAHTRTHEIYWYICCCCFCCVHLICHPLGAFQCEYEYSVSIYSIRCLFINNLCVDWIGNMNSAKWKTENTRHSQTHTRARSRSSQINGRTIQVGTKENVVDTYEYIYRDELEERRRKCVQKRGRIKLQLWPFIWEMLLCVRLRASSFAAFYFDIFLRLLAIFVCRLKSHECISNAPVRSLVRWCGISIWTNMQKSGPSKRDTDTHTRARRVKIFVGKTFLVHILCAYVCVCAKL